MAKTVLITGTSSGIGLLSKEFFAAQGWNVAACSRSLQSGPTQTATTEKLLSLRMDVTDEASVADAVAAAQDHFGAIDVLVNNAGYGLFGPLEGSTSGELEAQFDTNVFGVARVIRHVLPAMRTRKSGTIINVSSIAGRTAFPFGSGYNASKFALEGLSESLRFELSLYGIRVKLIEPSHFKTNFIARSLQCTSHSAYDAAFRNYRDWMEQEDEGPRS